MPHKLHASRLDNEIIDTTNNDNDDRLSELDIDIPDPGPQDDNDLVFESFSPDWDEVSLS